MDKWMWFSVVTHYTTNRYILYWSQSVKRQHSTLTETECEERAGFTTGHRVLWSVMTFHPELLSFWGFSSGWEKEKNMEEMWLTLFLFSLSGESFPRKLNLKGDVTSLLWDRIRASRPNKHLNEIQRLRMSIRIRGKWEKSITGCRIPFEMCCRWRLSWHFSLMLFHVVSLTVW